MTTVNGTMSGSMHSATRWPFQRFALVSCVEVVTDKSYLEIHSVLSAAMHQNAT
jgi:hypothetical protein